MMPAHLLCRACARYPHDVACPTWRAMPHAERMREAALASPHMTWPAPTGPWHVLRVYSAPSDVLPASAIPPADDRMVTQIREALRDHAVRDTVQLPPQGSPFRDVVRDHGAR